MAYAVGHEIDIFVSYAQVDNQDDWVADFKDELQKTVDQRLGRIGSAKVFLDLEGIQGNQNLTERIQHAITRSAVLVIVLSPGYLASEWCRQEREQFLSTISSGDNKSNRVFVVRYDHVEIANRPQELQSLVGYRFHTDETRPVIRPLPKSGVPENYSDELYKLRRDVADQLKVLAQQTDKPVPETNDAPTVFLAEVTPDLYRERSDVETYLLQGGLRVVPSEPYFHTPDGYQAAIDKALDESLLFVQLLGPHHFPATKEIANGFEQWQFERARAAGKPALRWRSPTWDVKQISESDRAHRDFVDAADVRVCDPEELKSAIVEQVREIVESSKVQLDGDAHHLVLVNAGENDGDLADDVGDLVDSLSDDAAKDCVRAAIVAPSVSLVEVAKKANKSGLLVLYGDCPLEWTEKKMRECRTTALKLRKRIRGCAVYVTTNGGKPPLSLLPPRFDVIQHGDEAGLRTFIQKVAAWEEG